MKMLLSTTALVVALGLPAQTFAQTQESSQMSGFLDRRGESDLFASDLIGHDVYARTAATDMQMENDNMDGMAMMTGADLDGMENIGQINEIVLSNDGQVRALVIGVGGFLGMGEQDVAVTMDQITLASDAEDRSEMYIVVNTGVDMLRESPAFDRSAMAGDHLMDGDAAGTAMTDDQMMDDDSMTNRTAFAAPQVERDGYVRVEATELSTEMLIGKSVYGVDDNDVGTVTDLILDDSGSISDVIIDFGGFLGLGVSQASIGYDELTIISNDGYEDVRLYVDATEEQIENLPEYDAQD